jgi:hypothetical protein
MVEHMSDRQTPEVISSQEDGGTAVEDPAKVLRLALSIQNTLDEVRKVDLEPEGLERLRDLHTQTVEQVKSMLSDDLQEEMETDIILPAPEEPTQAELRVAQARVVGWLEGLFRGIQATSFNRQMASQLQQLQQQRRDQGGAEPPTGQYL